MRIVLEFSLNRRNCFPSSKINQGQRDRHRRRAVFPGKPEIRGRIESWKEHLRVCRYVEEVPEQVRTQAPQGYQETVDAESQGEEVSADLVALPGPGNGDRVVLLVTSVSRREEHRHLHDLRGRRDPGGLRLQLLLLRRVRGEPEEREQRERDDHVMSTTVLVTEKDHLPDKSGSISFRWVGTRMGGFY